MAELAKPAATRESDAGLAARARTLAQSRLDVRAWPLARQVFLALLILYLGKQVLNVVVFPAFTGHDEVAHLAYLQTVATERRVPVLPDMQEWEAAVEAGQEPPGDFLPNYFYRYCLYILRWEPCYPNDPAYIENPFHVAIYSQGVGRKPVGYQYAANHPPLYYILMTPVYWLSADSSPETQMYLLRAAAIPFGLLTVLLAYRLARTLFPSDRFLAITVPAFVALQPQISYEAAMVNNDIVAIALFSWILYLLVVGIRDRFPLRTCVLTGFACGLALLAKGTSMTALPLVAAAVVLGVGIWHVRDWAVKGAVIGGMTALLSWPWYLFLYRTYGNFSGFDQISELQWWNYWGRSKPGFWELFWNRDFAVMRWKETWGEFGWRRIHLSDGLLWVIAVPLLVALVGLLVYALRTGLTGGGGQALDPMMCPRRWQVYGLLTMALTVVVAYLAVVQFGTQFELTQARYYFPAMNAAALLLMLGLRTLIPAGWRHYGQSAILASLLLMNVLIYTQYVVPYRLEGWP